MSSISPEAVQSRSRGTSAIRPGRSSTRGVIGGCIKVMSRLMRHAVVQRFSCLWQGGIVGQARTVRTAPRPGKRDDGVVLKNSLGAPSCPNPYGQSVRRTLRSFGMAEWLPSCFGRAGGARRFRCSTFACSLRWSSPAPHRSPNQSRPSLPFRLAAGARSVQGNGSSRNACAGGCLQWLSIASLCCCDALSSVVLSERAVRRLQTGRQSCAKLILFRLQPRSLAEAITLAGEGRDRRCLLYTSPSPRDRG